MSLLKYFFLFICICVYIFKLICITERIAWCFEACHCIAYVLLNTLHYVARQNIMWQERNLDFFSSNCQTTFHFFPLISCLLE